MIILDFVYAHLGYYCGDSIQTTIEQRIHRAHHRSGEMILLGGDCLVCVLLFSPQKRNSTLAQDVVIKYL